VVTLADIIACLQTEEIEEEDPVDLSDVEVIVRDDGTVVFPEEPEADEGSPAPDVAQPDEPGEPASAVGYEPPVRRVRERLVGELRFAGDPAGLALTGAGPTGSAGPGAVALADGPGAAAGFGGSLLICSEEDADDAAPAPGAAVLLTPRPRLVFALIVDSFFPELLDDAPPHFHCDRDADQAALAHACVMNAFLGPRVSFGPHASVGCTDVEYERAPDGRLVRVPQMGTVILEGDTDIGPQATVHRAEAGATRVCRGAKVGAWSEIGGGAVLGRDSLVGADVRIGSGARIGDRAIVEQTSSVAEGVSVGAGARILAGTVVTTDVPDGETWGGEPAGPVEAAG